MSIESKVDKIVEIIFGSYETEDVDVAITDMLTDIRHFCDWRAVDFHKALDFSYDHYEAEKREED